MLHGIHSLAETRVMEPEGWSYLVLGLSGLLEGYSLWVATRQVAASAKWVSRHRLLFRFLLSFLLLLLACLPCLGCLDGSCCCLACLSAWRAGCLLDPWLTGPSSAGRYHYESFCHVLPEPCAPPAACLYCLPVLQGTRDEHAAVHPGGVRPDHGGGHDGGRGRGGRPPHRK